MAIIDARYLRTLTVSEKLGDKQTKQLSANEDYLILTDEKNPNFADILNDENKWPNLFGNRLPQLRDQVTFNGIRFYCNSRDLSYFKDNERAVKMAVRYDAKDEKDDEQPDPPNDNDPDSWQRITIQSQQITEPALGWDTRQETIGKAQVGGGQKTAQNSAGDPVDGLEEDTAMVRLTYTNTQVLNPEFQQLQNYTNTCNDQPFLGGIEYTVRCVGWSGEYDQKNQVWSISVEFLYKPNDWSIEFYDVGFNEIVNGKRQAILDVAGNPVSKPVPLDGNGQAAPFTGSNNDQPPDLSIRYLFPYPSRDLNQIWADCRI
jgi:hypothetical protein